jgi:hypothetical protein
MDKMVQNAVRAIRREAPAFRELEMAIYTISNEVT